MWKSHLHNPNVFYIILTKMKSETIPIIYENSEIFVINKRQGLPVQGGAGISHSVDSDLAAQVGRKIYLVHRLDKETSGLLVCAKNPAAAAKWTRIVGDKTVEKEYKALCFGAMKNPRGRICSDIVERGVKKRAETFYETEGIFAIPWESSEAHSEIATEDCAEILRNENPRGDSFGNCDRNSSEKNWGNSFGNCGEKMNGNFVKEKSGNSFGNRGGNSAEKNWGNSFGNRDKKMNGNFVEEKFENSFGNCSKKTNENFTEGNFRNSFGNRSGTMDKNSFGNRDEKMNGNSSEEKSGNSFENRGKEMHGNFTERKSENSFGNRGEKMNENSAEKNSMNAFGGGLHNSCELLAKSRSFGDDIPRYISLLRLRLGTGRTHQLRIHLAGEGVPICGDDKYGDFATNRLLKKQFGIKRLCLCAFRLTVPLPGGRCTFEIEADFVRFLEALRAEK